MSARSFDFKSGSGRERRRASTLNGSFKKKAAATATSDGEPIASASAKTLENWRKSGQFRMNATPDNGLDSDYRVPRSNSTSSVSSSVGPDSPSKVPYVHTRDVDPKQKYVHDS